jgi:hypothetical protein
MSHKAAKIGRLQERVQVARSAHADKEIAMLDRLIQQQEQINDLKELLKGWRTWYDNVEPRSKAADLYLKSLEIV